jgi:uncharacterized protein YbjT (DUF2867 family)
MEPSPATGARIDHDGLPPQVPSAGPSFASAGGAAAVAALFDDEAGKRIYELGGPPFDLSELARTITEVTGTPVAYRDLPVEEYAASLQRDGLDDVTARFVASLDASIAGGELETDSQDLAHLLGRPATPLADVVAAAYPRSAPSDHRSPTTISWAVRRG